LDYKQAKVTTLIDYHGHNFTMPVHRAFNNEMRESSALSEKHPPDHCVIM